MNNIEVISTKKRAEEIDFVKGSMIILMVIGHINYIGEMKQFLWNIHEAIYKFHIPIFFLVSGYLLHKRDDFIDSCIKLFRMIGIPYFIFSLGYLFMLHFATLKGLQVSTDSIPPSITHYLKVILLDPIGAYWFLHTLIIYRLTIYLSDYISKRLVINYLIIASILLIIIISSPVNFKISSATYLITGIIIYRLGLLLPKNPMAILPTIFIALAWNLGYISPSEYIQIFLVISILSITLYVGSCQNLLIIKIITYIGKNTLVILLFHCYFLNIFKFTSRFFLKLDSSGLFYLFTITVLSIFGSMLIAYICDLLYISYYVFGINKLYRKYNMNVPIISTVKSVSECN